MIKRNDIRKLTNLFVRAIPAVHGQVASLVDSDAAPVITGELVREAGGQGQGPLGT